MDISLLTTFKDFPAAFLFVQINKILQFDKKNTYRFNALGQA